MGAGGSTAVAPSNHDLSLANEEKRVLAEDKDRLEKVNKELKHRLEQTKDENKRKSQELEAHRSKIASLTVEINKLRSGDDDNWSEMDLNQFRIKQQVNKQIADDPASGGGFRLSRHNITRRVSQYSNHGGSSSSAVTTGKSVGDPQNRTPSRIAKLLNQHRREKTKKNGPKNLGVGNGEAVIALPRGGVYVYTKAGPIQFGIVPETLKDSMNLGLDVPTVFVVPRERFNVEMGINISEVEFPAFFNFFIKKRSMTLVTYGDCSDDLYTIMKEALDGPDPHQLYIDEEYSRFASKEILEARPDHLKEMAYFREPRPGTPTIKVGNLIKFAFFNALGECHLDNDVVIKDESYGYTVLESDGTVVATVTDDEAKSCFFPADDVAEDSSTVEDVASSSDCEEVQQMFNIPRFGLTILGNSHGFDPNGLTSGFVIWINGQGIMVDPPPHSGALLKRSGIQPKLITATILTHCHADHDAGTIQKIITEDKITLMTTKTIFHSLLRKYSGVAGLGSDFLRQLVNFRPVFIEEPTYWGGASFRFFYSLHAIPCVGFEVSFEGKRMIYSADTFYEPEGLNKMCERGILSPARRDALINFRWDCDLVLHEAGVPPIHTPLSAFEALPEEYRKNIVLIHIGAKEQRDAIERGFQVSQTGIEHTRVLIAGDDQKETLKFLQLIASVDIFKSFPITQALELLLMSSQVNYSPGDIIAEKGSPGDKFMIIMSGEASVSFGQTKKIFRVGDYLGEISVITGEERTATIVAETKGTIIEVDKYAFHYFLMKDKKLYSKMECLVQSRMNSSWHAIARNSVLRNLSAAQKTSLQAFLHLKKFKKDDIVWKKGDVAQFAVLVLSGDFKFVEVHEADPYELLTATRHPKHNMSTQEDDCVEPFDLLTTGCFIVDCLSLSANVELTCTLKCGSDEGTMFFISQENILGFLDANPLILLALLKQIVLL